MQNAETVLSVLRERGRRGLPCTQLYRQLFNQELYLLAYGRLYANKGAMTRGVSSETVDGMSLGKIRDITALMRQERYRFAPARRVHIPKKSGGVRPLGMPTWSDKLVGEVVRLLLEAYYEPQFSGRSHGFRRNRGCHTALREVVNTWRGTAWFIEGDISDCFGSFDHGVMLSILAEKIHDGRFLRLIGNMLKAGYLEDWTWRATYSGAPQGGVASPILSNIYLDRLDTFVETVLIPEYTRGEVRRFDREYRRISSAISNMRVSGRIDPVRLRELKLRRSRMPSMDTRDPGYRRLRYVRYADDVLLGFAGPKSEAEQIKARLGSFLRNELALALHPEKTLITHGRTNAARFLGYEISVQQNDRKLTRGQRFVNGDIRLAVPATVVKDKCKPYMRRGKPETRTDMVNLSDYSIVADYGSKYRGIVQYYLPATNVRQLNRLHWVMLTSMLKTLACKHKSRVKTMANRYKATIETPRGPRRCFEAGFPRQGRKPLIARFGGVSLARQRKAVIKDRISTFTIYPKKELIPRLLKGRCELCEQRTDVEVHHVRKLADLAKVGTPQPEWARVMTEQRRIALVVCRYCHDAIHDGDRQRSQDDHWRAG